MANPVGSLLVRIGADTGGLTRGGKRAKSTMRGMAKEARASATRMAKLSAATSATAAAIGAELVRRGSEAVTEQQRLARSLGATNKEAAGLTAAFKTFKMEQDDVSDALGTLSDRADDAVNGMQSMQDDFKLVGLGVDDLKGKRPTELFRAMSKGIAETEDPTKRTAAAVRVFGDDLGRKLMPMLMRGPDALDKFTKQAESLGLSLTKLESTQVEQANESMEQIMLAVDGISQRLAIELSPILKGIADRFFGVQGEAINVEKAVSDFVDDAIDGAGFVMDSVEGIRRTLTLLQQGLGVVAAGGVEAFFNLGSAILEFPLKAVNSLIDQINVIPGIEIPEIDQPDFVEDFRKKTDQARRVTEQGVSAMHEILMEPMPSQQLDRFVKKSEKSAKEAARFTIEQENLKKNRILEIQSELQSELDKRRAELRKKGGSDKGEEKDNREELEKRLERMREEAMSEREVLREKQQKERELLREAKEKELEIEGGYDKRMRELKDRHQKQMEKLNSKSWETQLGQTQDVLQGMTTLMNSESRKMFEIGKAAAIANSMINAYEAITGAYKVGAGIGGPVLGATFAAAASAAQFAQVQAIQSQSFNGGGGGKGAGGGGGSNTQSVNNKSEEVGGGNGGGASGPTTMINLQGDSFGRDQVRDLLDRINEEGRDGGRLVIN